MTLWKKHLSYAKQATSHELLENAWSLPTVDLWWLLRTAKPYDNQANVVVLLPVNIVEPLISSLAALLKYLTIAIFLHSYWGSYCAGFEALCVVRGNVHFQILLFPSIHSSQG